MNVLEVEGIQKKFCADFKRSLVYGLSDIGGEIFGIRDYSDILRKGEFWALDSISFTLEQGKSVGLIGSNGAGKTTLLRMISGLIKPDKGSIKVTKSIAPLIALGAGFNPILTGRENIFVNMSILGLTSKQIKDRFDEVVEFAELGHALDMPVQSYSSGMAARLGFACAILTTPELLVIDEVLAVGDLKFRSKCYRKLAELKKAGTSFILVSHNSQTILSVCEEAIYLKKGKLIFHGSSHEGINKYEVDLFAKNSATDGSVHKYIQPKKPSNLTSGIDILEIAITNEQNEEVNVITSGGNYNICIKIFSHSDFEDVAVAMLIREIDSESNNVIFADSRIDKCKFDFKRGSFEIKFKMIPCALKNGLYSVKLNINQNNIMIFDTTDTFRFLVSSLDKTLTVSSLNQPRGWDFIPIKSN